MRDYGLERIHFNQKFEENSLLEQHLPPLIKKNMHLFFEAGMKERSDSIIPLIKTFNANINGPMTDSDFREFAKTIIDQIRELL